MNPHYTNPSSKHYDQKPPPQLSQYPQSNIQYQPKVNFNQPNPQGKNQYSVTVGGQIPQNQQNQHNELFQQYADSKKYGKQAPQSSPVLQQNQAIYFPPPQQHPGLTQPPQLHQSQDQDDVSDPSRNPNNMQQSASNQNEVRQILWGQQQQANTFWQQKFFLIYEKFQWFGSRFQLLKGQYATLSQQLITVDSQEDWNELKHHHEQFSQKLQEMFQQLIAVADENQQLINQRLEQNDGVWQRRYHQLLSNFKALQQKTSMLQVQNQDLKTSQEGEFAQQQQNYPELLSHYRNLQEEYEKLFNAYNKLQQENEQLKSAPQENGPSLEDFENMRMQYQRTLEGIQNQNDGLKLQCQAFYEENQHFRQQLQAQSQQLTEIERLGRQIKEKSSFIQSLNEQLSDWRRKYQQLQAQHVELLSKETEKVRMSTRKYESKIQELDQQIISKESQINNLSKRLSEQVRIKQKLITDHRQEIAKAVQLQSEKQVRLRLSVQKELKSLQIQYETILEQVNRTDANKYQIDSLRKKIQYLEDQNSQLANEISNKNKELIALRNVTLQLATYQNILQQYKALEKDKLALQETNRKQHNQLLQTKKKLTQLEHQFSELQNLHSSVNQKTQSSSQFKQIQSEFELQVSKSLKLESEVQKYKQLIEAKQKYIRQLQDENSKILAKIQHQQKVIQGSRQDHQSEIMMLQRKIQTLEQRNRNNELDFKKEMTENYEKEIKQLRLSNQDKLKKIKKLEENLIDLSTKSSHLQKHNSVHSSEQQLLQNKLTALEKSNSDLLTKLELSCNSVEALDQQLSAFKERQANLRSQVSNFIVQVQQADNLIKNKNNIIIEYEKQVQQFVQKVSTLQDRIDAQRYQKAQKIKKYQEQIQKLKQKLYSPPADNSRRESLYGHRYSSSYSNRYISFGTKNPNLSEVKSQEITKLETNLIEQMNEENSKLRSQILELTKKVHSLESLSRVIVNQESQKKSASKSKLAEQIPQRDVGPHNQFVQQRLLKFNERLQTCIHENQIIAVRDIDLTASQRVAIHEREKRQLENRYQKEIKELKTQIKTLNDQLFSIASQKDKLHDSDLKEFDKYDIMKEQAEKSTRQELQFLKVKLSDQQKTNSALIKLNQHLKKQLQESLQKGLHSTSEYYKLQWKQAQNSLQQEKQKNKKLQEENDRLKRENIDRDSKVIKDYQLKSFAFQEKLQALQRENTYLKMVKAKAENEKANYQHDIQVYTADIQSLKASSKAKIDHYEKIIKQLREKYSLLERELNEVNNSMKWGAMNGISRTVLANQKSGQNSSRRVLA